MNLLLLRFEDGTSELRPEWSPSIQSFGSDFPRAPHLAAIGDIDGLCIDGRMAYAISRWRFPLVFPRYHWVITGQDTETKALCGEWKAAHIETTDEQIERLTRERDAALARSMAAEDFVCAACGGKNKWKGGITYEAPEETT